MPTLYLTEPGSMLEKEYQRLLVTKDDAVLLRLPIQHVSQVVLVGRVGVTTPALHALLEADIPLQLVSRSGKLIGRLLPPTPANLPLRQEQYRRNADPAFSLELGRAIVRGKIRNQRILLQRLARRRLSGTGSAVEALAKAIQQAAAAAALPDLMGIEGQAARVYFAVYRQAFGPQWQSSRRTRRPPQDPLNALLSLGYTFLGNTLVTALEIAGLDPYLGFFHAEAYGRPALALDLLEEFRAPLIDSLVLGLLNRRVLSPEHFEPARAGQGVYLTPAGMRLFLAAYSQRLEAQIKVARLDRTLSYRKLLEVQARQMARCIEGLNPVYTPFQAR